MGTLGRAQLGGHTLLHKVKLKSEITYLCPHRTNQAGPIALASQNHVNLIVTNHTSQHQACGDDGSVISRLHKSVPSQGLKNHILEGTLLIELSAVASQP